MLGKTMFERAALFSALFAFILFGVVGMKYLEFMEAKNQADSTAVTNSP